MSDIRHNVSWDITAPGQRTFTDHPGGVNNPVIIDKITHETRAAEPTLRSGGEVTTAGNGAAQEGAFVSASNVLTVNLVYYTDDSIPGYSNARVQRIVAFEHWRKDSQWVGDPYLWDVSYEMLHRGYIIDCEGESPLNTPQTRQAHANILDGLYGGSSVLGTSVLYERYPTIERSMRIGSYGGAKPIVPRSSWYYNSHFINFPYSGEGSHVETRVQHDSWSSHLMDHVLESWTAPNVYAPGLPPKTVSINISQGYVRSIQPTKLTGWTRSFPPSMIKRHVEEVLSDAQISTHVAQKQLLVHVRIIPMGLYSVYNRTQTDWHGDSLLPGGDPVLLASIAPTSPEPWEPLKEPGAMNEVIAAVESIPCIRQASATLSLDNHRVKSGIYSDDFARPEWQVSTFTSHAGADIDWTRKINEDPPDTDSEPIDPFTIPGTPGGAIFRRGYLPYFGIGRPWPTSLHAPW